MASLDVRTFFPVSTNQIGESIPEARKKIQVWEMANAAFLLSFIFFLKCQCRLPFLQVALLLPCRLSPSVS